MVSVVLDNLAAGETPQKIVAGYRLAPEDVQAALLYAAELVLCLINTLKKSGYPDMLPLCEQDAPRNP
jgi:uncharacterized protein (DUF433 family)